MTASASPALLAALDQFEAPRGYLAAASIGLPCRATVAALVDDAHAWSRAELTPVDYLAHVDASRELFASIVGVPASAVAIGSQTAVQASLIAASIPSGAEVLCVDGDFTSIVFPFLQQRGLKVRHVPLAALADAIGPQTWLVVFSLIQSATGQVADVESIVMAAREHGARTFCDGTQAVGVHPVEASRFDAFVCHTYKWLCAPRGVSFLTLSADFAREVTPIQASWFAGDDPWANCYGPGMNLAADARRFDVSPAWNAWVGARPAFELFATLDIAEVWERCATLGDRLSEALGIPQQHQAIVTWPDVEGEHVRQLIAAGVMVSGRAGRARAAFHLWNDESDVDRVLEVLGR